MFLMAFLTNKCTKIKKKLVLGTYPFDICIFVVRIKLFQNEKKRLKVISNQLSRF